MSEDAEVDRDASLDTAVVITPPSTVAHRAIKIERVHIRRFKRFRDLDRQLADGVTLIAGANNAGKSTLLHALAVWEFCRVATIMERGTEGLLPQSMTRQGLGLGDEEFSPINVPSLKHLWTNLKSAKQPGDPDGYTLQVTAHWQLDGQEKFLGFALALANDRLFVKLSASNLAESDRIPVCAYLPPFAGIQAREERVSGAIRRRRMGEGLAGAVLRNLLLDMQQENARKREAFKALNQTNALKDSQRRQLRESDPWELLQDLTRRTFSKELSIAEFLEEYHSYIRIEVIAGRVDGHKLVRFRNYSPRDIMVEGSGFLQWLSVFALATSQSVDVLLLDEPDAHLHPSLQRAMIESLEALGESSGKQVLLATHSAEIIRSAEPTQIMEVKDSTARYLHTPEQKVSMLAGIGTVYSPRIDRIKETRRLFFYEGTADLAVIQQAARAIGRPVPNSWVGWQTPERHQDRKHIWAALCRDIGPIYAVSIRDRDTESLNSVGDGLLDKVFDHKDDDQFVPLKWRRRHIEGYLLHPLLIAKAAKMDAEDVVERLRTDHGLAIGDNYLNNQPETTVLELDGKAILESFGLNAGKVAPHLRNELVCEDLRTVIHRLYEDAPPLTK